MRLTEAILRRIIREEFDDLSTYLDRIASESESELSDRWADIEDAIKDLEGADFFVKNGVSRGNG